MGDKGDKHEQIEEIVSQAVKEVVEDLTEKALMSASPKLIRKSIWIEVKGMVLNLLGWFIIMVLAILVLNLVYITYNDTSIQNASLEIIKTLNTTTLIKHYLSLGTYCILAFTIVAYTFSKFEPKKYEKNRKRLIEFRNTMYVLFIISLCLTSLTLDQLNLASLVVSIVILFKFIFKTNITVPENEIKNIMNKKNVEIWNQQLEEEKAKKRENKD